MRIPFNGKYPITQHFNDACCREYYKRTFGMSGHNGIDYGLPVGVPVVAAHAGTVYKGYDAGGYGNFVLVTGGGYESVYAHLSRVDLPTGAVVQAGYQVGLSGNTGNSSGPHLHFGVRPIGYDRNNGFYGYINPQPLLNQEITMTREQAIDMFSKLVGRQPNQTEAAYWTGRGAFELYSAAKSDLDQRFAVTQKDRDYWYNRAKQLEAQTPENYSKLITEIKTVVDKYD